MSHSWSILKVNSHTLSMYLSFKYERPKERVLYQIIISLISCILLGFSLVGYCQVDEDQKSGVPVKLGVSPWSNPQLLYAWIEPMRAELESQTGYAFSVSSAANHEQYLIANIEDKFNVAQVPMHMSLYLIRYHQFIPVLFARAELRTYILTAADSGINTLSELNEYEYLLPDPLAVVSFMTKEALPNKPLNTFNHSRNHWSVLNALLDGEYKAGSVLSPMYDGLSPAMKNKFKVLYRSAYNFDGVYLMSPRSTVESRENVFKILNGFEPQTKSIIKKLEPVTEKEMQYWFATMGHYADMIHQHFESNQSLNRVPDSNQ